MLARLVQLWVYWYLALVKFTANNVIYSMRKTGIDSVLLINHE